MFNGCFYKYEIIDNKHLKVWNSDRKTWITYHIEKDYMDIVFNDTGVLNLLKKHGVLN